MRDDTDAEAINSIVRGTTSKEIVLMAKEAVSLFQ